MNPKGFLKNEDAVSITVGFILILFITVIIFSAIVISFYTLTQDTQRAAMMESFDILGSAFASRVTSMDTLANITVSNGGTVNQLEYDFSIPATIANEGYGINITRQRVYMDAENNAKAWIPFNSSYNITEQIYSSAQDYTLRYNTSKKSIIIEQQ